MQNPENQPGITANDQTKSAMDAAWLPQKMPGSVRTARNPVFTGWSLYDRNRAKYLQIVRALKNGEPVTAIAKRLRCSAHTVIAVRELEANDLPLPKRMTAAWVRQLMFSEPERMDAEMAKLPARNLIKLACIASDHILCVR